MQGTLVPKLTLSVRNGPSVSFGTNVPYTLTDIIRLNNLTK